MSLHISTHAPYTEGDGLKLPLAVTVSLFQLTPPIQRATQTFSKLIVSHLYFNSRPLYRGRRGDNDNGGTKVISTHAPYTEGDELQGC